MNIPRKVVLVVLLICLPIVAVLGGGWWLLEHGWVGTQALDSALQPIIDRKNPEISPVASAILNGYKEVRFNASGWSFVYWGFTFCSAILSALAAMILKVETIIQNEGVKKDVAAGFSIIAALLITISTSGDFQRKWQANRIAAAELEQLAYDFLGQNLNRSGNYVSSIGKILLKRNLAIAGEGVRAEKSSEATPESGTLGVH